MGSQLNKMTKVIDEAVGEATRNAMPRAEREDVKIADPASFGGNPRPRKKKRRKRG